jgi:hypothetical protein
LSYTIAILVHGTAAIGLVFTAVLSLVMLLGPKFGLNLATTARHRSFVYTVFISVCVITLTRWIIVGGIETITVPLSGLIENLFGAQNEMWVGAQYVSLYDQHVSSVISYAWAIPVSLGVAFSFYHLIKRSQKKSVDVAFALSLSLAAAGLAVVGFLGSTIMAYGNLQRYLGYAGMTLFFPVAALGCMTVLKSLSWKIVSICLITMVLFSGIAVCDYTLSPQLYEVESVTVATSADFIEAETMFTFLSNKTSIVSTYEMITALHYLDLTSELPDKIGFYVGSLKVHRMYAENLTALEEAVPGVTYVLKPGILEPLADAPVNVIYNSGRHVAVKGAD